MSQTHSPLDEQPIESPAPPEPDQNQKGRNRKRAHTFCGSSFGVVRLEDLNEIANLKADLVACYRPVNSQEMFALERMAIAQQLILRAARFDAGLFTSALNTVLDRFDNPIVPMDVDMVGNGDIEITRAQNRNYCVAEGLRRIAKESDLINLSIRYRVQADRDYRRALEEFQRLERLRPKLPNEPDLLTTPDGEDDIAPLSEVNPWIPDAPAKAAADSKTEPAASSQPAMVPLPANIPVMPSNPEEKPLRPAAVALRSPAPLTRVAPAAGITSRLPFLHSFAPPAPSRRTHKTRRAKQTTSSPARSSCSSSMPVAAMKTAPFRSADAPSNSAARANPPAQPVDPCPG